MNIISLQKIYKFFYVMRFFLKCVLYISKKIL